MMKIFHVVYIVSSLIFDVRGQITTSPRLQPVNLDLKHVSKCCTIAHLRAPERLVECVNRSTDAHRGELSKTWLSQSDQKIAMVTYGTSNTFNYSAYAFAVNEAYSEHNGYLFHLADPKESNYEPFDARWNKVKIVEAAMDSWAQDADFIVWLDADLIIMDMGLKLERVIDQYPEAHLWFSIEHAGSHNLVNSGFMIVRNSDFIRWLLQEWWNTGDRQFLADQDSFDQFYAKYKVEKQLEKKVALLPADALNSEPPAAAHQKSYNQVQHLMGEHTVYRKRAFGSAFREICRFYIQEHGDDDVDDDGEGTGEESESADEIEEEEEEEEVESEDHDDDNDETDEDGDDGEDGDNDGDEEEDDDDSEDRDEEGEGAGSQIATDIPIVPLLPQLGADQIHLLAWALIEYKKAYQEQVSIFTQSNERAEVDSTSEHQEATRVQYMNNCASRYAEVLESIEQHWDPRDIKALRNGKRNVLDKLLEGLPGAAVDPLLRNRKHTSESVVGAHPHVGSEVRLKTFFIHLRNVEISERVMERTLMTGERQVLLYELLDHGRTALKLMKSVKERKKLVSTLLAYADELYELVPQPRKIPVLTLQSELLIARGMIFFDEKEPEEGLDNYLRALRVKERIAKEVGDHSLPMVQIVVADALCRMNRFQESWPYFDRAVEISERRLGPTHPQVAGYCYLAGQGRLAGGDHQSAIKFLQKAIAGMEANTMSGGEESPDLVRARSLLQIAFQRQQQAKDASLKGAGKRSLEEVEDEEKVKIDDSSKSSKKKKSKGKNKKSKKKNKKNKEATLKEFANSEL